MPNNILHGIIPKKPRKNEAFMSLTYLFKLTTFLCECFIALVRQ
ncbi:hypothetical protein [uncultured Gammaproteobacteria bacterium]|nr:hypothetical protein [uncultured Gammaproteobacteria bacterium]SMN13101.1 hypothetical protein BHECKSOX2_78 [Bathymodiolus heckerae thiotrophic gill symbiont]